MDGELTIFHTASAGSSETNAMKIVEFLGKTIRRVQLTHEALAKQEPAELLPEGGCFIVSAVTLAEVCKGAEEGFKLLRPLLRRARKAFVYGFQRAPEHVGVLKELTSGRILGIEAFRPEDARFQIEPSFQRICAQFSGLTLGNADAARDFVFAERNEHSGCSCLIRIGRRPCFVFTEEDGCQLFLSACSDVADLDVLVPRHTSRLRFFSSLVPLMMFVTSNWSREVWHNESPRACFIIDDPLLTERYGFLEYRKLLEVMERGRFCTSMAFIPWNFRRSHPEVAQLFASHPQRYSLCVHGCDHTGGEYGTADYKLLRSKSQKAMDRMSRHKADLGVDFDDVMVFPQGIFSRTAVEAIKSCNYLAAVNSTAYPVDVENALALRDLLDVAVTRFSNFPIFLRRSPEDLAELAFDLFLGKPALLVEHHGYFKNGYEHIAEIVEKVNALDRRLEWTNLADICSQACVQRTMASGDVHTRFFTDRFSLQNDTTHSRKYTLFRRRSASQSAPAITIDGRTAQAFEDASWLKMELSLGPRQRANIRIEHQGKESSAVVTRERLAYKARVLVRRSLSEFRDNYVDKSEFLSKTARLLLNQGKLGIFKGTARGNS